MIKVEQMTVKLWGLFISAVAVIMALGYLDVVPLVISSGLANAAILFLLGLTIISEIVFSGTKRKYKDKFNIFGIFIGVLAILLAVIFASQYSIPPSLGGLVGALYLITAAFTVITVFTEQ